MARILIAEDRASLRGMLRKLLAPENTVDVAADIAAARSRLDAIDYELLVTDVRLPDGDGFELLKSCRVANPDTEVILMTAYATVGAAVAAVKAGAYDYLAKPFEPDEFLLKVQRALERRGLRLRARQAEHALARQSTTAQMLGDCAAMRRVRELIGRVADLDVTVLITGESGTGKEVAARCLHDLSARRDHQFVAVNCGGIPEKLIESELFGHARGAFTGAISDRSGFFADAGAGTLFLDEIGDLPLDLQVKLNRALQERRYRRVGESRERTVEARILAATHQDLRGAVAKGAFREDLLFRLDVYPIELPPLRARGEDVLLFAQHFLAVACERFGRPPAQLSPEAVARLLTHDWPGNVRELGHAMERAIILADGPLILPEHLPEADRGPAVERAGDLSQMSYRGAMELERQRAARRYLDALLRRHEGRVTQAARQAGIERETLHRLIRGAGLSASDYRQIGAQK